MVTVYRKSLSNNFGGNLNTDNLLSEITDEPEITVECYSVINLNDNVDISFANDLSLEERDILDQVISTHDHTVKSISNLIEIVQPLKAYSTLKVFEKVAVYLYNGNNMSTINNVKVVTYKDSDIDSYELQVIDVTNQKKIGEAIFYNNDESINNIENFINVPQNEAILEISIKNNGGSPTSKVYISLIKIFIENDL